MNTATISVIIDGLPVGKERHRDREHRTPVRTRDYQSRVAAAVGTAAGGLRLFNGLVETRMTVVWPRPLRRPSVVSAEAWDSGRRVFASSACDLDNVVKATWDGVNRSGVWLDDRRVARSREEQVYAAVGERPHVELVIAAMDDQLDRPASPMPRPAAPPPVLQAVL